MNPGIKDGVAKAIGYLLGALVAGLLLFWAVFKIWNVVALFRH